MTKRRSSIQHYVSKMFIRRFMNGRTRLHVLSIDSSDMKYGKLRTSFGKTELWDNTTEKKLGKLENELNKILQNFDEIKITKQPKHKCTVWEVDDSSQKSVITKMALLQPNLLKDLKDSKHFENNILQILNNDHSKKIESVFYVKLYKEHCNGKFLITDYLGQAFIDDHIFFNSIPTVTIEEFKSGNFKSKINQSSITHANYFITGEHEFFFVGKKEQLHNFLGVLRKPTICFVGNDGKEYEYNKKQIDVFELTTFNLNEINAQESQCEVGSYDEKYLKEIKKNLPDVVSSKIMFRKTQCVSKLNH